MQRLYQMMRPNRYGDCYNTDLLHSFSFRRFLFPSIDSHSVTTFG
ncbi:MAG: hypothetical protein RIC07_10280 [Coleofasciculus sp. E1-EBD-02]